MAITAADTTHIFVADADQWPTQHLCEKAVYELSDNPHESKLALVVPAIQQKATNTRTVCIPERESSYWFTADAESEWVRLSVLRKHITVL